MKKLILLFPITLIVSYTFGQTNAFPEDGNVGIGTTSPSKKLEIASGLNDGTNPPILRLTSKDLNAEPNQLLGEIQFYNKDADGEHKSSFIKGLAAETYGRKGKLVFGTSGTNSTDAVERMCIDENGNIGIGTTLPQSILNIKNNTSNGSIIILERYSPNSLIGGIRFTAGYDNYEDWSGIEAYGTGGLDQQDLRFYTAYGTRSERMRITQHGKVGIGTTNPEYKLDVAGTIRACEIKVDLNSGECPDYVFSDNYNLMSLENLENYIIENNHLPEIKSANEMETEGLDLKEMNVKLLKKMEEMTLYMIEINKELESLRHANSELKEKIETLQ